MSIENGVNFGLDKIGHAFCGGLKDARNFSRVLLTNTKKMPAKK